MGKQFRQKKNNQVKVEAKQQQPQVIKQQPAVQDKAVISKEKKKQAKSKGKQNRLIVRNLVFDIREKHLQKLFAPYGEIKEIQVPLNPNNEKCNKGFAFVEFAKYRSCQKAIKELNQSMYKGRPIVIDFSVAKMRYMTEQIKQDEQSDHQQKDQQINQKDQPKVQDQNKYEENVKNQEGREYPQRQTQDLSKTIFIRNLPGNVDADALKKFCAHYGKVKWTRVVIDKETGTSKGSAFVRYYNSEDAQNLIDYSRNYELFLLGKNPQFKRDPKINLQIEGTIVKIFPGQKRQSIAEKMKSRQEGNDIKKPVKLKPLKKIKKLKDLIAYDKEGKRHIELAQLGLWEPHQNMTEQDQQRFKQHSREKIEKLKNPNNSVSDKRVILKYLDKSITQEQIKDVAMEFLSGNNLPKKTLTYCKLMLDKQRQRSAGYAFLQFSTDFAARQFVQQLAQNQEVLMPRPFVVQFALQDSRKMQKINRKKGA